MKGLFVDLIAQHPGLSEELAAIELQEPVAYDILEARVYGAPGETAHKMLWVEHYRKEDGSTPDLDWLLERYSQGIVVDGGKTISIRPLYVTPPGTTALLRQALETILTQDCSDDFPSRDRTIEAIRIHLGETK